MKIVSRCAGLLALVVSLSASEAAGQSRAAPQPVTLAVADFSVSGLDTTYTWLGSSFAESMIDQLLQTAGIRVVEREQLDQVIDELELQMSDLFDERTAARVGRLLGAHYMVFGSVGVLGDEAVARARVVEIEKGEVVESAEAIGSADRLLQLQRALGEILSDDLAVEAAVRAAESDTTRLDLSAYRMVDEARRLAETIPPVGVDPQRRSRSGEYRQGRRLAHEILDEHPNLATGHWLAGRFALQLDEVEEARVAFETAARMRPSDPRFELALANLALVEGDLAEAQHAFEAYLERFRRDGWAWFGLATALERDGQLLDAVSAYIESARNQPHPSSVESRLRALLLELDGLGELERLGRVDPGLEATAQALLRHWSGRPDAAFSFLLEAEGAYPDLYLIHYLKGLHAMGEGAEVAARSYFERALSLEPGFAAAHRNLAVVNARLGDCRRAEEHAQMYLRFEKHIDDFDALSAVLDECGR